jgi:hypothetical protein
MNAIERENEILKKAMSEKHHAELRFLERIAKLEDENTELKELLKTSMVQHDIVGGLYQDCRNAALEEAAVKCEDTIEGWGDVAEESGMRTCAIEIRSMKT